MDGHEVSATCLVAQLCQGLNEGHALNVTDSASELDDADIGLFVGSVHRDECDTPDPVLNGIGNVGNTTDVSRNSVWLASKTERTEC